MNKKVLLAFFICVLITSVKAQIPNSGFENWTTTLSVETPDGWSTLNPITAVSTLYTAEKASPGNPGSYYLKLTSKSINGAIVPGIAIAGTMNMQTLQPISGFPCNVRPTALTGKWQHMIYGTSQGSIEILLSRWDNSSNKRVSVGSGKVTLSGMAMSWANFNIPITYADLNNPDSCMIILKASGDMPTAKDYLWIDNLAFSGVSGIPTLENNKLNIQLYPNPVKEKLEIYVQSNNISNGKLEVIDMTGKCHYTENVNVSIGENIYSVETDEFPAGVYFLSLTTDKIKKCCRFMHH